jgi:hypothetical protein
VLCKTQYRIEKFAPAKSQAPITSSHHDFDVAGRNADKSRKQIPIAAALQLNLGQFPALETMTGIPIRILLHPILLSITLSGPRKPESLFEELVQFLVLSFAYLESIRLVERAENGFGEESLESLVKVEELGIIGHFEGTSTLLFISGSHKFMLCKSRCLFDFVFVLRLADCVSHIRKSLYHRRLLDRSIGF